MLYAPFDVLCDMLSSHVFSLDVFFSIYLTPICP